MEYLASALLMLFSQTTQVTHVTTTQYEDVPRAICREFKDECPLALAIFTAESGLRPNAIGDSGRSIGIAQINLPSHASKIPSDDKVAWLSNFQNNLKLAKQIKDTSGWYPWSVYTDGTYKAFYK